MPHPMVDAWVAEASDRLPEATAHRAVAEAWAAATTVAMAAAWVAVTSSSFHLLGCSSQAVVWAVDSSH